MPYDIKNLSKKQQIKRKKILESAIKVFAKKGFHKTKISDIAKLADVADGTIYLYFKNKDDLLITSFEELIYEKLDLLNRRIQRIPDKLERIRKFIEYHIVQFTNTPDVARFFIMELRQSSDFYEKYSNFSPLTKYLDFIQKLCDDAIEDKVMRKVDTRVLAISIFGIIDFVLTEWSLGSTDVDLKNFARKAMDIIQRGLIPKPVKK